MSCKIYLDNYSGVFYPGNEIRGRLECYFSDETSVRGIKVRLKCNEFNQWMSTEEYTDPADKKRKTRTVTNTGNHDVVRMEQLLFGSESGSRQLGKGKHVYDFIFLLSSLVPSSYHGPYGSISYKLKGVVDRPMRTDYEDTFLFNVMSPIDFNQPEYKNLLEAVTYSDDKSVCCWCCQGGSINLDVEFPKTAFAVGEKVPFAVRISNMSNSNVEELNIKLEKKITYRVTSPNREKKSDSEKILSMQEHGVGAHGEHTYNLHLDIPGHLEAPNFAACDLFGVDYELSINCAMPTCVLDLDINIYPKIGHVAALSMEEQHHPYSGTTSEQYQQQEAPAPYPPVPFPENGTFVPPYPPYPPVPTPPGPNPPGQGGYGFTTPSYPNKPSYPGGMPTAPSADDNLKAREAAGNNSQSGGPSAPDLPPSYYEAYPNNK